MKIVLQRVIEASVESDGRISGKIGTGLCLLVGIQKGDTAEEAHYLANKILDLRIFPDDEGKMNRSVLDIKGQILAVSQFTLAGSIEKGRRPSFDGAEEPGAAKALFDRFINFLEQSSLKVEKGVFGGMMQVRILNDGPVTFILERRQKV